MTHYLTADDLRRVLKAAQRIIQQRTEAFFAWRNLPSIDETKENPQLAWETVQHKLNGVYGERMALSLALLPALLHAGHRLALLQKAVESTPFDSSGWLVLSVDGFPLFHMEAHDWTEVADLVTVVPEDSPEADVHRWKNTTKVDELVMLLTWVQAGLEVPGKV